MPEVRQLEAILLGRFNAPTVAELHQHCQEILQLLAGEGHEPERLANNHWNDLVVLRNDQGQPLEEGRLHAAWIRDMQAQWAVLDHELRPKAVEAGAEWIPALWSGRICDYLARVDSDRRIDLTVHCEALT